MTLLLREWQQYYWVKTKSMLGGVLLSDPQQILIQQTENV